MMTPVKMPECLKAYALVEDEHPQEECGVIGVFAPNDAVARMAFFGLFALQHRGQEAAGIAVSNGSYIEMDKDVGLVSKVFTPAEPSPQSAPRLFERTRLPGHWQPPATATG